MSTGRGRSRRSTPRGKRGGRRGGGGRDEESRRARELSDQRGIPFGHARRVVRGEVSLNEVLKGLMRRERARQLVEREGMAPELAGQVARGELSRERADQVQRARRHRRHSLARDGLTIAALEERPVALLAFGDDWRVVRVRSARTYDVDLESDSGRRWTVDKHDVKLLCPPEHVEAARARAELDAAVRAEGLGATARRDERVRPCEARLLELLEAGSRVRCVLRDGSVHRGRIRSFSRWDLELEVDEASGARVTVFFHALHRATSWGD